jgi:hypothetical protein
VELVKLQHAGLDLLGLVVALEAQLPTTAVSKSRSPLIIEESSPDFSKVKVALTVFGLFFFGLKANLFYNKKIAERFKKNSDRFGTAAFV